MAYLFALSRVSVSVLRYARWIGSIWLVLAFLALGMFWQAAHEAMIASSGERVRVVEIVVGQGDGEVVLGRDTLGLRNEGADSPEAAHLSLYTEFDVATPEKTLWTARNIAQVRRVLLDYEDFGQLFLRRWEIRNGDLLRIDGHRFKVEIGSEMGDAPFPSLRVAALDADGAVLREYTVGPTGDRFAGVLDHRYAVGQNPNRWQDDCSPTGPPSPWDRALSKIRSWFEREVAYRYRGLDDAPVFKQLRSSLREEEWPVIALGGTADCVDQLSVPGTRPHAARIVLRDGLFFLTPGRHGASLVVFQRKDAPTWKTFSDIERPLIGHAGNCGDNAKIYCVGSREFGKLKSVIVGRTVFGVGLDVEKQPGALVVRPISNNHLYHDLSEEEASERELLGANASALEEKIASAPDRITIEPHWDDEEEATLANLSPAGFVAALFGLFVQEDETATGDDGPVGKINLALKNPIVWTPLIVGGFLAIGLLKTVSRLIGSARGSRFGQDPDWNTSIEFGLGGAGRRFVQITILCLASYLAWYIIIGVDPGGSPLSRDAFHDLLLALWGLATFTILLSPYMDRELVPIREGGGLRLGLGGVWLVFSCLMILGVLCLELLSLGASNTRMARFDAKHIQSVAISLFIVQVVCLVSMRHFAWLASLLVRDRNEGASGAVALSVVAAAATIWLTWHFFEESDWFVTILVAAPVGVFAVVWIAARLVARNLTSSLRLLAFFALVLSYALWLFVGSEEGLLGIQPVELGKLWCVLLIAYVFTQIDYNRFFDQFYVKDPVINFLGSDQFLVPNSRIMLFLLLTSLLFFCFIFLFYSFIEDNNMVYVWIIGFWFFLNILFYMTDYRLDYLFTIFLIFFAVWTFLYYYYNFSLIVYYSFPAVILTFLLLPLLAVWRMESLTVFGIAMLFNVGVFLVFPVLQSDFSPVLIIGTTTLLTLCLICGSFILRGVPSALSLRADQSAPPGSTYERWQLILFVPGTGKPRPFWKWSSRCLFVVGLAFLVLGYLTSWVNMTVIGALMVLVSFFMIRFWFEAAVFFIAIALLGGGYLTGKSYIEETKAKIEAGETLGLGTVETRIAINEFPESFPDAGYQLFESLRFVELARDDSWDGVLARLPWGGPRHWLERARCAMAASGGKSDAACEAPDQPEIGVEDRFKPYSLRLQRLPAVQDDFVMTFFINRFGFDFAAGVMVLQALMIILMLHLATSRSVGVRGSYRYDTLRQFLRFAVIGGAILTLLHWMISWGNVTGLIPIMGQPMTWFSAANSHILFMALPVLSITLLLARLSPRAS